MTRFRLPAFLALLLLAARPAAAQSLELAVLGSGGPGAVGRAASCFLVVVDGIPRILVDAGPGSFARLGESGLSLAGADIILLTHLHADHAGELPGLIKARAVAVRADIDFKVFGPEGHKEGGGRAYFPAASRLFALLFGAHGAFAYLTDFSGHIGFKVTDLPAAGAELRVIHSEPGLTISAIAGHHRDAPAVIYRVDHGGKSITFGGDIDESGHANLRRIAAGTSLLVFNSVVLDPPQAPPILYTLHTPPAAIGELARDSGAGALLLAHLSPATDGNRGEVEASIRRSYGGPVTFAEDKMRVAP
jgi:ribonuclease BN (tRNA processing enzyme)